MMENIPLFECPDKDMEEMYYYRWWTLRKHIKNTPVGYGMTEFLVNRNYSDKYNLIACAIGHHIYESRWLRDQKYLDGIINTWYHGPWDRSLHNFQKQHSSRYFHDADLHVKALSPDIFQTSTRQCLLHDTFLLPAVYYCDSVPICWHL